VLKSFVIQAGLAIYQRPPLSRYLPCFQRRAVPRSHSKQTGDGVRPDWCVAAGSAQASGSNDVILATSSTALRKGHLRPRVWLRLRVYRGCLSCAVFFQCVESARRRERAHAAAVYASACLQFTACVPFSNKHPARVHHLHTPSVCRARLEHVQERFSALFLVAAIVLLLTVIDRQRRAARAR